MSSLEFLLWVLIGAVASWLHVTLLRWTLNRLRASEARKAARLVTAGMPVRLLLLSPVLLLAARSGIYSSVGLIIGFSAGRWAYFLAVGLHRPGAIIGERG